MIKELMLNLGLIQRKYISFKEFKNRLNLISDINFINNCCVRSYKNLMDKQKRKV